MAVRSKVMYVIAGLAVGALVMPPAVAVAKEILDVNVVNPPTSPVPVAGKVGIDAARNTVTIGGQAKAVLGIPETAFSVTTVNSVQVVHGPDPADTKYAITSFTGQNLTDLPATINLHQGFVTESEDCVVPLGQTQQLHVTVPAHDTVHLVFTQPFTFNKLSGKPRCLQAGTVVPFGTSAMVTGYTYTD
jgi:hypothetical protein